MKKYMTLIAFLSCLSCNIFAQVCIEGYVLLYSNKSEGIPNVYVSKDNGVPSKTDNNGYFKIKFSGELDRKQVRLEVLPITSGTYKNYVVMEVDGYHYIENINITAGRLDPVKISVCPPQEFEKMVLNLAKPYLDKALVDKNRQLEKLNRENETLKLTNKEFNDRKNRIEEEYKILENNYIELSAKFARIDPELADINLKKAREYFEKGDIENAKNCLPAYETIKNEVSRHKREMSFWLSFDKVEGKIYDAIQKYDDLLDVTGNNNDKFQLLMDCSEYLFQNKIFDTVFANKSYIYAKEANELSLSKVKPMPVVNQIQSYNLLAKIQNEQKVPNYYKNYKTAIEIFNNSKRDSIAKKDIAISYTMLADYYKQNKKYQVAENNYKRAISLYIALFKNNESDDFNYLQCLIKTADLYSITGKTTLLVQCNERIDMLMKVIKLDEESQADINMLMGNLNLNNNPVVALRNYDLALWYYLTKDTMIYKDKVVKAALGAALACNNDGYYTKIIEYCGYISNRINIDSTAIGAAVHALLGNAYKRGKYIKNKELKKYHFNKTEEISKKIKDKKLDNFIYSIKYERWILWRDLLVYSAIGWGAAYFSFLIPLL